MFSNFEWYGQYLSRNSRFSSFRVKKNSWFCLFFFCSKFVGPCFCLNNWRINCHVFPRKDTQGPLACSYWNVVHYFRKKYLKFCVSSLGQSLLTSPVLFSWERYPGVFGLVAIEIWYTISENYLIIMSVLFRLLSLL